MARFLKVQETGGGVRPFFPGNAQVSTTALQRAITSAKRGTTQVAFCGTGMKYFAAVI
jgi:hypothetical protein